MRCGSSTTLYCLTKPPTLATSATPSALASANFRFQSWMRARVGEVQFLGHHARIGRPSRRRWRPDRCVGVTPAGSRDAARVEEFQHARARPVDVGAVLEDDVDERDAEERKPAHHLGFRHRQHRRGQRIGDLVLDHLRRLSRIFGVDDDLRVGEIGDGVERQVQQRIEPGSDGEAGAEQHQQQVARRPGDEAGDHCSALPLSREALQRRFEIAFGVDQEVGRDDDLFAFGDAVAYFDIAAAAAAELDVARLEPALALVDEHDLPAAAVEHGAFGNGQHRLRRPPVSISASTYMSARSTCIRIRQLDPDARGARLRIQVRIDQRNRAGEALPLESLRPDRRRSEPTAICARSRSATSISTQTDAMIGDPEQYVAGRGPHAVDGVALQDIRRPAARARRPTTIPRGCARCRRWPLPERRDFPACAARPSAAVAVVPAVERREIFRRRAGQRGAVDLHQRLALADVRCRW